MQETVRVLGLIPGGEYGSPLQYSCPDNPMDRGAWRATVHSVSKNRTQLKQLSTDTDSPLQQKSLSLEAAFHSNPIPVLTNLLPVPYTQQLQPCWPSIDLFLLRLGIFALALSWGWNPSP